MEFNSIIYNDCSDFEIAKDYVLFHLKNNDEIFIKNFMQILKQLNLRYSTKNGNLIFKDGTSAKFPIELSLKNSLGELQRAEIIKKLNHHKFSYEVRIDGQYEHKRLLFFIYKVDIDSIVFTFGFTKINNNNNSDQTDNTAIKTDSIYSIVHSSYNERLKWIGDDNNEYKF
jgi:uncharacterized FlgJ-related protein